MASVSNSSRSPFQAFLCTLIPLFYWSRTEIKNVLSARIRHRDFRLHTACSFVRVHKVVRCITAAAKAIACPPSANLAAVLIAALCAEMPFAVSPSRRAVPHLKRSRKKKLAELFSAGISSDIPIHPPRGTIDRLGPVRAAAIRHNPHPSEDDRYEQGPQWHE